MRPIIGDREYFEGISKIKYENIDEILIKKFISNLKNLNV